MSEYIIEGGKTLQGEVEISGSKNAALPIIAATILNAGKTTLYNVPNIHDTQMMFEILKKIGGKVTIKANKIVIDTSKVDRYEIPEELMRQMRSSIILAGGLIGKHRKATFSYPGGCDIGTRPIELHLKAFEKLGINITKNYGNIECSCDKIIGEKIDLDFPSVGATENAILASVLAEGTTTIDNAAKEPHIVDLANFLNTMGADIRGAGTDVIKINGVKELKGNATYSIVPDQIEAGTFMLAAIASKGDVTIHNCITKHLEPVIAKIQEIGGNVDANGDHVRVWWTKRTTKANIKTLPYPGFPTDLQSQMGVVLSMSAGTSIINESIWDSRFQYTQELNKMGAKITTSGKTAIFEGVDYLYGAPVTATDLRAGAALIMAGTSANGVTEVFNLHHIDRGYENIEEKFRKLGANIERVQYTEE